MSRRAAAALLLAALLAGCSGEPATTGKKAEAEKKPFRPPILLVTLDTTRADALTPEVAPNFTKLARRGIYFEQAYSTAPSTLTAHASMMSGLYPAGHGIHENGRFLESGVPLVAEELKELGYTTLAFVSGYPLDGHFGLSRGFGLYDDDFGTDEKGVARVERPAAKTIEQVVPYIGTAARLDMPPYFVWVHFYDPHEPYAPPEPFRGKFSGDPYLGEIAAMDDALGKLVGYFERATFPKGRKILVLADHGEGRGEHGEMLHGNLLYQGVMQVPMAIAGDGVEEARRTDPVSSRQVRATLLSWARGKTEEGSLLEPSTAPVLGEAMQPFLNFRWQPQVMAVGGNIKLIRSGRFEIYDVLADPAEKNDLALAGNEPERALAKAIADYPLPTARPGADVKDLGIEERQKLASLGYIASESTPTRVPENAPRAADMTPLFAELDAASHEFVGGAYQQAAARFEKILAADPGNLMAAVRMAVSLSLIGRDAQAMEAFARAKKIDPESLEVSHYLAMHHMKNRRPEQAAPLFEKVLAAQPNRHAALAGLAEIALGKGQLERAAELFQKSLPSAPEPGPVRIELARLRMELGQTEAAIEAFEAARNDYGKERFRYDLELGVLYLAERNFEAARDALDRVPADHPAYALALFKRAQVSVLLAEPDRAEKVKAALAKADPESRRLIQNEKLFAGLLPR
jgi:choline-sulfatase